MFQSLLTNIAAIILVYTCVIPLHASTSEVVSGYFGNKTEIYLKVNCDKQEQIQQIAHTLSIASIDNMTVFAYANRTNFENFLSMNLPYEVMTHPSELTKDITMSDYPPNTLKKTTASSASDPSQITSYPTYQGYINLLNSFQQNYPSICKVSELGKSIKGKTIYLVTISNNVQATVREKEPDVLITSSIHGNETVGLMLGLRAVEYLCKNYSSDQRVKNIVDSTKIIFSPMSNPDGTYAGGDASVTNATRGNANGVDLNRTFPGPQGSDEDIQVETKLLISLDTLNKYVLGIDFHGGTEGAMIPWGYTKNKVPESSWWSYVGSLYGKTSGYTASLASAMYTAKGSRIDWPYWGARFRNVTIEASTDYVLPVSKFDSYWKKNQPALLDFFDYARHCLKGVVTDSVTEKGIENVKIFVNGVDTSFTFCYSKSVYGDYYRPIVEGKYDITFSHDGYQTKTIKGVDVKNNVPTVLDVKLIPTNVSTRMSIAENQAPFRISQTGKGFHCTLGSLSDNAAVDVYSVDGKSVGSLFTLNKNGADISLNWKNKKSISGYYIISIKNRDQESTTGIIVK